MSHTLSNTFLERIMCDALEEQDGHLSIGGRNIANLRLGDGIDTLVKKEQEVETPVDKV